tara:strand:+ start:6978 stop:7658 length:681 start_codon:yes stop_codon:yes gene_type:complete
MEGIDLTQENQITVTHGQTDVVVHYPSFKELASGIQKLLKDRLKVSTKGVDDVSTQARLAFFQEHATGIEGLSFRRGDDEVKPLCEQANWKELTPPNVAAASASPFDELGTAEMMASEIIGDPTVISMDTLLGEVAFTFPPYTDEAFQKGLKRFVAADRVRQRGRRFELTGHQVNLNFFKTWCQGGEGVILADGQASLGDIPLNWAVSVCRPFISQETLTQEETGN